jgi:hypothetical protein
MAAVTLALPAATRAYGAEPEASPSPETVLAPNDVGFLLPLEIDQNRLRLYERINVRMDDQEALTKVEAFNSQDARLLQSILVALGKEPTDLAFAQRWEVEEGHLEGVHIDATRVRGISADELLHELVIRTSDSEYGLEDLRHEVVDGKDVYSLFDDQRNNYLFRVADGEVLFDLGQYSYGSDDDQVPPRWLLQSLLDVLP